MKNFKNIIIAIVVFSFAITGFVLAENWENPTGTAPGNNAPSPINTSNANQVKEGGLSLGNLSVTGSVALGTLTGNVGIGTVVPSSKLDVNGSIQASKYLKIKAWPEVDKYGTGEGEIWYRGSGGTSPIKNKSLVMESKLYVKGPIVTKGADFMLWNDNRGGVGTSLGRALVHLGDGTKASSRLVINYASDFEKGVVINGNVGLGKEPTSHNLDILGTINSDSNIYASSFLHSSDINLKTNLKQISGKEFLNILNQEKIKGYTFNWKENGKKDAGIMAQEIETYLPQLVEKDDKGNKTVNYDGLIAPVIEAVKEQQKIIDNQQKRIEKLEKILYNLENKR